MMDPHSHNGIDSPQLEPAVSLIGFAPQLVTSATTAPTDTPQDGTIRFLYDSTPNYRLWYRINKTWKSTSLT